MLKALGGVDAAGALRLRGIVGIMAFDATSDGSDDSRSPASRRQRLVRVPSLPAERLQALGVPRPPTVADNRRDVIWDAHGVTGTCCGSGSGD